MKEYEIDKIEGYIDANSKTLKVYVAENEGVKEAFNKRAEDGYKLVTIFKPFSGKDENNKDIHFAIWEREKIKSR